MPISYEHKCIYVHIPKCAGSAFERVLSIKKRNRKQLHGPDGHGDFLQHFTILQIRNHLAINFSNLTFNDYYTFAIIRNPYSKLVSDFAWCKRWFKHKWIVKDSTKIGFKTFEEYIHFIQTVGVHGWSHFRPQHEFVDNSCAIYKLENLKNDYPKIKSILNIEHDLPVVNKSRHKHWKTYYTPEITSIVNELYAQDFTQFEYPYLTFN